MTGLPKENREFLTRSEVAALLNVSPNTITRWAEAGLLRCSRTLGGHRRYEKEAVEKLARTFMEEEKGVESTTFTIPKMYGDHHVTAVRKELLALSGVEGVWASAALQQVQVNYDPNAITAKQIGAKLEEAGYPINNEQRPQAPYKGDKDPAWGSLSLRMTQTYSSTSA